MILSLIETLFGSLHQFIQRIMLILRYALKEVPIRARTEI